MDYSPGLYTAIKNALLIRSRAEKNTIFYENNPFVTIDRLVFKLKHIDKGDLIWEYNNVFEVEANVFINLSNINNILRIEIINRSNHLFVVQKGLVRLIDILFNILFCNDRILLEPMNSIILYEKINVSLNDFHYALFKIKENEFKILDLVQMKDFS